MIDFIQNIQKKPKRVRMRLFIIIMIIAVIVVSFFWAKSVGGNIKEAKSAEGILQSDLPSIYESVSASVKDIFGENKIQLK